MAEATATPPAFGAAGAEVYERNMGRWSRRLAPLLLDFVGDEALPDGAEILDLGCGTGSLTFALAARHPAARITGCDIAAPLLAHARAANPAPGRVGFEHGDACALPFPNGRFDQVLSSLVLMFLPDAGAGRFYLCPGSHRTVPVLRNAGKLDFAKGHERYKRAVLDTIRAHGLELRSPFMAKGDVLFWSSLTVHGSFAATARGVSRTSLTAHYLPEEDEMLQFHTRVRGQRMMRVNGMQVAQLHDQDVLRNRLVRGIAANAPGPYAAARKLAMQGLFLTGKLRQGQSAKPAVSAPVLAE